MALKTTFTLLFGSAATDAKKALRPLTSPATTGADHVSPPVVDLASMTLAWPLVWLPHATYSVPFGAMESEGNVRASWRKLEPGKGDTKSSVTEATVMF